MRQFMEPILEAKSLNLWYGQNHALHDLSLIHI